MTEYFTATLFAFLGVFAISGCSRTATNEFAFVDEILFPLPVEKWEDTITSPGWTRTVSFTCSFEDYMDWLVAIEEYREHEDLNSDSDVTERRDAGVAELSRRKPGNHHQGMFIGWVNTFDRGGKSFHIRIFSHVVEEGIVEVEITGSWLEK